MTFTSLLRSVAVATVTMALFCTSANAQNMRLFYDINTGNVRVEVIDSMINLFSIETADQTGDDTNGFLIPGGVSATSPFGVPNSADASTIAFLDSASPFPVGVFDVGNILPPGIVFQSTDATNRLSTATDAAGSPIGFGALAFTITGGGSEGNQQVAFETVTSAIPEPTTLPLIVMASSLLLNRRRRR